MGEVVSGIDRGAIRRAARVLAEGGTVIYPTETVYGIGCDPFREESVKRVFELKKRELKPMPVLCADLDQLDKVADMSSEELELALLFWPGPLTLVTKRRPSLPPLLTAFKDEVAVRIPASLIALELMRAAGMPIVGTSANLSGMPSPSSLSDVPSHLIDNVSITIDGGPALYKVPSTVVKIKGSMILIIREGALRAEEISRRVCGAGLGYEVRTS